MKFICDKVKIQDAISIVQKAITGKSPMPILEGVFITAKDNMLTLIASDIDLSIQTRIDARVIEEGSVVIDAKIFGDIIRKLPNSEISIETKESSIISIHCQKSDFDLVHMNSADFPNIPAIQEDMIFSIPQGTLKNMIKGTSFAVAQEETRPILTGVLFEIKENTLNLVALDGYRLALRNELIDTENTIKAVIPGKTLNEVSKILEDSEEIVNITFTNNHILFSLGRTKVISRLLEGEFLPYESIIPQEYKLRVITNRGSLLSCIERASLMAKEGNTNLIKFDIQPNNIIITSNSQLGKVKEEVDCILQGETLQIAFNSKYLIDVLKIMDDEEITMELTSSISPCIIRNKNTQNCQYLVLPVRLVK